MQLSEAEAVVAILSFCTAVLAGFIALLWRLWRLEFRVAAMWKFLTTEPPNTKRRGRRRTDLPVLYSSADDTATVDKERP